MLAREYGYARWQALVAEVQRRLGQPLEWAVSEARRIIHDNDIERLKQLLTEYPELLSWQGEGEDDGGVLGMATHSYSDSGEPERERTFTRAACAEFLIDAGAIVVPSVCDGLVRARAKGLLQLFERKGLLPRTLKFSVALGEIDSVRARLAAGDDDVAAVSKAFRLACLFQDENMASLLLGRLIAFDANLGRQIDDGPGRSTFIKYLMEEDALAFFHATPEGPWQQFRMHQIVRAIHDDDLAGIVRGLQQESWLLGNEWVDFQVGLVERSILRDRGPFIAALLDLDPALLRRRPPPRSQALEFAFTYGKTPLLPMLTRVWPIPGDLPHSAGVGDLDRVKKWFDASGKPALGDVSNHFPSNNARTPSNLAWGVPVVQQVFDTALAWAVINHHFEVADFLLAHGADINTRWSSHEPASILHELVFRNDYEAMQFLIDRGIDLTIRDHRWGATAQGWAYAAAKDEKMAEWLGEAQRRKGGDEGNLE